MDEDNRLKLEGRILLFDTVNLNKDVFPKTCKIYIPEKLPLLWNFDWYNKTIGIAEASIDDKGIITKAELFSESYLGLDNIRSIFTDNKIGVGGYYNKIKKHIEGNLTIVDEAYLRAISLTLAPVNEEYMLKIVEGENESR